MVSLFQKGVPAVLGVLGLSNWVPLLYCGPNLLGRFFSQPGVRDSQGSQTLWKQFDRKAFWGPPQVYVIFSTAASLGVWGNG